MQPRRREDKKAYIRISGASATFFPFIKCGSIRQEFHEIGSQIDSIYRTDPDRALFILEKLEEERRLIQSVILRA